MWKLVRSLFAKKVRFSALAVVRDRNPFADFLSDCSSANPAELPAPTRSTILRVELKRPCVDTLFEREQASIHEAFRIIDKNGDGKISQEELGAMWVRMGQKVTDEELRLMVEEADKNGDGEIDLEEFVELNGNVGLGFGGHEEDQQRRLEDLRVAFNVADSDRDGFISAEDLQKVMKRLGKRKATIGETSTMVKCVDSDGDSKLHFEDFSKLMTSTVLTHHKR